jgi:hypothetical protein
VSAYAFYFLGVVLVLFLVGFVAYYSYRLGTARKRLAEESASDLERFVRGGVPTGPDEAGAPSAPTMGADGTQPAALGVVQPGTPAMPAAVAPGSMAPSQTYERGPGLRTITDDSVFMRLDKDGEVIFQIGEKPAMPLKYLLDASARSILQQLSRRATADYGQSWAILAAEDETGRLTITRLA